jgi:hypothetical protein
MSSSQRYGVLLFDAAYDQLYKALKPYVQTGSIGKYFYCTDVGPDGAFFKMSFTPELVENRIDDPMTIWIPIQFVKFWVKSSSKKSIPGFTNG